MSRSEMIESILRAEFEPEFLEIIDDSWRHAGHAGVRESGGGHFQIRIKSLSFNNLSRIKCHRQIHQALASLFPSEIHALSIEIIEKT